MVSKKITYVIVFAIASTIYASDSDRRREEIEKQFQERIRSEARQNQPTNNAFYDMLNNNTERAPNQNRR